MDTTSIYFEGNGGDTLGEYGNSKDKRPDLKQMIIAVVLDGDGLPLCCELWPGNTADVKSLIPVMDRLRERFHISRVCVVANRGMISKETMRELESRGLSYILGAKLRSVKEIRENVLARAGRYKEVRPATMKSKDPSPLKVKEVTVPGGRYIVCLNEDQARKDAQDREAILASLKDQLKRGSKSFVGNKGYRKYLKTNGSAFKIDLEKAKEEARYDGKWVLKTNTDLDASEVALKYKQFWMVEQAFRDLKSVLETRPVYHKRDETIRGHVFSIFLALVLRKELEDRLASRQENLSWGEIKQDLDALDETMVTHEGKHFVLRSECQGSAGRVFRAVGVALPPTFRIVE
jgi:transposase